MTGQTVSIHKVRCATSTFFWRIVIDSLDHLVISDLKLFGITSHMPPASIASLYFMRCGFVPTKCRLRLAVLTVTDVCDMGGIDVNVAALQPIRSLSWSLTYETVFYLRLVLSMATECGPIGSVSCLSEVIDSTLSPINAMSRSRFTAKFSWTRNFVSVTLWLIWMTSGTLPTTQKLIAVADCSPCDSTRLMEVLHYASTGCTRIWCEPAPVLTV